MSTTLLGINTDICSSTGSPEMVLRAISEAGFTHLHWCHHWYSDYIYSRHEWAQYKEWMSLFNLKLLDVHGSEGIEKCWYSTEEYRRKAGVELVLNRIEMMDYLEGSGCLMMHAPAIRTYFSDELMAEQRRQHEALRRSLDELMPSLEKYGIILAIENMASDTCELLAAIMKDYPAERIGITYDSGHGNINEAKGLDNLEPLKNRIQALHLNDNDCSGDQHQAPFYGTLDWNRVARLLKSSSYATTGRPLSFELGMNGSRFFNKELETQTYESMVQFLVDAHERAEKVQALYQ